jgi:flagellar M-ring protein FliF
MSPVKRITLAGLLIGTLAGFFLLMTWTGEIRFQHLFSNVSPEDAGEVVNYLKEHKIPYRISGNGGVIMVPEENVYECRLALAAKGLPQGGGIGFEVFDNTKLGMTEFVQNVNYQRALQGELSRTINRISEVESSRVHVVLPEKSLFIEQEEPATASVVLKLHSGRWLSAEQVQGIVHLVSSSVSRLKPENVTVVDTSGKLLAGYSDNSAATRLTSDQLEYQEKLERNMETRVKTMLEKALGRDKAVVRLSCALDFKRQEMTEERYYPENRVIRSEQTLQEKSADTIALPAGIPGVRTNIAPAPTAEDTGSAGYEKQDRTVNYEIGRLTSHTVEPVARLKRVSVAVIVDGNYESVAKPSGGSDWKYVPRSADEMTQLEKIVKSAVNFDAERGDRVEVVNIAFHTEKLPVAADEQPKPGWTERLQQLTDPLKYLFFAIFLLCSFLFIVRPIVRWLTSATVHDVEMLTQLPKTVGEIEREYGKLSGGGSYRDELNRLLTAEGDASVDVTREWLKQT